MMRLAVDVLKPVKTVNGGKNDAMDYSLVGDV
jgi:hypothetical protein